MSSVQDYVECKQCGYAYANYLYTRGVGSEWLSCPCCGYSYESGPERNSKHEVALDGNGQWIWKTSESKGYGALCYRMKGQAGWFVHALNEDCVERLKSEVQASRDAGEFEERPFYLTRWNEQTRCVEVALGTLPPGPPFDICEQQPEAVSSEDVDWPFPPEGGLPF